MADISRLSRLLNGVSRQVSINENTLVVDNLKIKMGSGNDAFHATFTGTLTAARTITMPDANVDLGQLNSHLNGGASKHDATEVDYERADGSKKNISASSDDVESALSDLDDAIGALDATPSNYTAADPSIVADHLAGIDAVLASVGTGTVKVSSNDSTPGYLEDKLVSANALLTITAINDGGNEDVQFTVNNSSIDHGLLTGLGDDDHTQYHNDARGDARYYQKTEFVTTATAGAPVKLDGAGKIAVAQLPSAVMTYEGVWNASTNSPTLADGTGDTGMVYRVGTSGSQNLGSGSISFEAGDYVIYNGTVWEKSDGTDAVVSVNGATGVVTVNAINQLTGDVTTTAASGSQSKATTVASIQGVTVAGTTGTGNVVFSASPTLTGTLTAGTISASGNVTGANLSGTNTGDQTITLTGDVTGSGTGSFSTTIANNAVTTVKINNTAVTAAKLGSDVAGAGLSGGNGSALVVDYSPSVQAAGEIAGESFAATTLFAVRYGQNAETAGRMYKADNNAASTDNFHVVGLVFTVGSVSAAGTLPNVHKMGLMTVTGHGFTVGKPVWLSTSGALTSTAPSAADSAVVKVGMVKDANTIDVCVQVMGVN